MAAQGHHFLGMDPHAALHQLLRRVDGGDEHKVGFRLSQIASLG